MLTVSDSSGTDTGPRSLDSWLAHRTLFLS
jgi:hypothetical protein